MCGFAGWLAGSRARSGLDLTATVRAMAATIAHRGPDDEAIWADDEAGVALGFRRLAVRDLSVAGRQPMASACGRWIIVLNGEIYNTDELLADLACRGRRVRSSSDTEILLETIAERGLEPTLARLIGMFAFALWDRHERVLVLARDRLGKKPLYLAEHAAGLVFGSELRALMAFPLLERRVDPAALHGFLRRGYVSGEQAILAGVRRLPPGSYAVADVAKGALRVERYWDAVALFEQGQRSPLECSDTEATDELEALLGDAVRRRLVADVPIGAFLSGGIDSSTVVALMQQQSSRPVLTFAIGSTEPSHDEAGFAAAVARHLGTEHHELIVGPGEAAATIPELAGRYDEPLADPSAIPTLLVSRLAQSQVTVTLSGDGGDELFGGYDHYLRALRIGRGLAAMPAWSWRLIAGAIRQLPDEAIARHSALLPQQLRPGNLVERAKRLAQLDRAASPEEILLAIVGTVASPKDFLGIAPAGEGPGSRPVDLIDPLLRLQLADIQTWLVDDILVKLDRATMAFGLEGRCPLLDHRVVALAARLPRRFRSRDGRSKWLLREVLERHVPRRLFDRPKRGFGLPVGEWLRGPLRPWAEALLTPEALASRDQLLAGPVRRLWDEHQARLVDRGRPLWTILTYLAWCQGWLDGRRASTAISRSAATCVPVSPC